MQGANAPREALMREFTESYMGKVFYFCLKRTGDQDSAEDLTQDIALNILTALDKGVIPTSFSAWVWQIARNRYAAWADRKHKHREAVTGSDIGDYEIEDGSEGVLDEMIRSEQLSLLRRTLAFIKSDYRTVVVAYYIEGRSIRDIASALSLSEGTVKQRLFRARKLIKEGMDMARGFGKRSYRPEHVDFAASGSQPSGLPWRAVQRSIPKNILLEASNNPSTAEELSLELGIALPYMEEEIELLRRATLLEQHGDRYITNFFILDKDCQNDIYHTLRQSAKERSAHIKTIITDILPDVRALGITGDHIEDAAIRWWLVPHIIDCAIKDTITNASAYAPPQRANGETWGFVGYEAVEHPEATSMSHNGCGNENNMFWTYVPHEPSLLDQWKEPSYEQAILLCDCLRNHRPISSFTEAERGYWEQIDGKYAHGNEVGEVIPDVLVFSLEQWRALNDMIQAQPAYTFLLHIFKDLHDKIEEIFRRYNHKILHEHIGYNIFMELFATRMMAIHDLIEDNDLSLPAPATKCNWGMFIQLK